MSVATRQVLAYGMAVGGPVGALLLATLVAVRLDAGRGSVVALWGLGCLASCGVVGWLARRVVGDRVAGGMALGLGALVPVIGVGTLQSWGAPVISAYFTCGMTIASLLVMAPFVGFPSVLLTGMGFALGRRVERRYTLGAIVASALVGLVAAGVAARGLTRWSLPEADDWPRTLPVVATLGHGMSEAALPSGVVLVRACDGEDARCSVHLLGAGGVVGLEHDWRVERGASMRVRWDELRGITVVEPSSGRRMAFGPDLAPLEVRPSTLSGSIGPPRALIGLAAFGWILGLLIWLAALAPLRSVGRLERGREGRVVGDTVCFEDGGLPTQGMLVDALPDGPAVVHPLARVGETTYRSIAGPAGWRGTSGRGVDQLLALRQRVLGRALLASAVAGFTATPLLLIG